MSTLAWYAASGRSWATRAGDQMSRLPISASLPPADRQARLAATMPAAGAGAGGRPTGPGGDEVGWRDTRQRLLQQLSFMLAPWRAMQQGADSPAPVLPSAHTRQ